MTTAKPQNIRVLLVEDNADDSDLLRLMLGDDDPVAFELVHVERLASALLRLEDAQFDAVLLDLSLPDSEGMDSFSRLRAAAPEVPIVVLTGLDDESVALRAVQEGAQDYLVKGAADAGVLRRSLLYAIERQQAERQLKRFADDLARSNRDLEMFASVVSHELKDPLFTVEVLTGVLRSTHTEALGQEGNRQLDRILAAIRRMQTLITDLLTYSRVTTEARAFAPVNLSVLVREVLSDLRDYIEEAGAVVVVAELPTISADETQLRLLLYNLIRNAVKFRRKGIRPEVHVRARSLPAADSAEGGEVVLEVEDNGIGFDEKYLDRIFDVFQRLHSREEYEGTGMGLAICRRIVDRHGGSIDAHSTPGQGSTFVVTLPVEAPAAARGMPRE